MSGPETFTLYQNYPNPFNPSTHINYSLTQSTEVIVTVFDISGREITAFAPGYQSTGQYQIVWNGQNSHVNMVSAGVYFCRLRTPAQTQTVKMVLLR